jgi:phosphoribosylanthranilate isomerase
MSKKVKICGLKTAKDVKIACKYKADFIGFVLCKKSPRHISATHAKDLIKLTPARVKIAVVTLNPSDKEIDNIIKHFYPDYLQLHGEETPERVQEIKDRYNLKIIKAINVSSKKDIKSAENYQNIADHILFDSAKGGSGKSFDWKLLKNTKLTNDYFLSGGLNLDNIDEALDISDAAMIDISSGVEKTRGEKDPKKIKEFLQHIKSD